MWRKYYIFVALSVLVAVAPSFGDEWQNYDSPGWRNVSFASLGPDGSIWTQGGSTNVGNLVRCRYLGGEVSWRHYGRYNSVVTPEFVHSIYADLSGLWIGTYEGLVLFSGYDTRTYTTDNSALADNFVHRICGDGQGGIWVATYRGLSHVNDDLWTTFTSESTILPGELRYCVMDYDESSGLLALTAGTGDSLALYIYDEHEWYSWSSDNSELVVGSPQDIAFDHDGRLWIAFGEDGGLQSFDGVNWTQYTEENSGLPISNVSDIAVSLDGEIYVVCKSVCKFLNGRWVILPITTHSADPSFQGLLFDAEGALWVFSNEGHIRLQEGLRTLHYPTTMGLIDARAHNRIVCSRFSDAVWIAGYGLCRFQGGSWEAWTQDNSALESTVIRDIEEAPDASIWVLNGGDSLDRFDGQEWTNFSRGIGYFHPDCRAQDLVIDDDYVVYVATSDGLLRFDWECWTKFPAPDGRGLVAIAVDEASGTLYAIGESFKLHTFVNEEWQTIELENQFYVCSLAVDRDGVVWGTADNPPNCGAFSSDGQTVRYYRSSNCDIREGPVKQVAVDEDNVKWFAMSSEKLPGGGICSFDGTVWMTYTCQNSGLVQRWDDWTPAFIAVACDDNGDKWFGSTDFGASKLSDIGTPDPLPSLQLFLNQPEYQVGDVMNVSLIETNLARNSWDVNLMIAVMLPDGGLYYFPLWTAAANVFMFQTLRPGTHSEPEVFFEIEMADWLPKGEYTWFAGLATQDGIVGQIATARFQLQ